MKTVCDPAQLSLNGFFDESAIVDSANYLIEMLNDRRPAKERYHAQYYTTHGPYWVFMVANSKRDVLFNVLDSAGKIPPGLAANWRTLPHIKEEIGL